MAPIPLRAAVHDALSNLLCGCLVRISFQGVPKVPWEHFRVQLGGSTSLQYLVKNDRGEAALIDVEVCEREPFGEIVADGFLRHRWAYPVLDPVGLPERPFPLPPCCCHVRGGYAGGLSDGTATWETGVCPCPCALFVPFAAGGHAAQQERALTCGKTGQGLVEVAGIEPASFSFAVGLLRAQPASDCRGRHFCRRQCRPVTDGCVLSVQSV